MRRTLGRAYRRFHGDHPRRPPGPLSRVTEILTDVLLGAGFVLGIAGLAIAVGNLIRGPHPLGVTLGGGLALLGAALLLLWERVAWEPFEDQLRDLS